MTPMNVADCLSEAQKDAGKQKQDKTLSSIAVRIFWSSEPQQD